MGKRSGFAALAVAMLAVLVIGCGGGGSSSESSTGTGGAPLPPKILAWNPPSTFSDSSPLDPATDLTVYEIYVNQTGSFSDADVPMAFVASYDQTTHQLITSFDLSNLGQYLSRGVTYHVSLRSVAIAGAKSGFSPTASFSF